MQVTSAQYVAENGQNTAVIATVDNVEWRIPLDPANRHYAAILEWVAEGNTIQEAG